LPLHILTLYLTDVDGLAIDIRLRAKLEHQISALRM